MFTLEISDNVIRERANKSTTSNCAIQSILMFFNPCVYTHNLVSLLQRFLAFGQKKCAFSNLILLWIPSLFLMIWQGLVTRGILILFKIILLVSEFIPHPQEFSYSLFS